jgi:hypothetical protein
VPVPVPVPDAEAPMGFPARLPSRR